MCGEINGLTRYACTAVSGKNQIPPCRLYSCSQNTQTVLSNVSTNRRKRPTRPDSSDSSHLTLSSGSPSSMTSSPPNIWPNNPGTSLGTPSIPSSPARRSTTCKNRANNASCTQRKNMVLYRHRQDGTSTQRSGKPHLPVAWCQAVGVIQEILHFPPRWRQPYYCTYRISNHVEYHELNNTVEALPFSPPLLRKMRLPYLAAEAPPSPFRPSMRQRPAAPRPRYIERVAGLFLCDPCPLDQRARSQSRKRQAVNARWRP